VRQLAGAERIDERPEEQDLIALVRAAREDPAIALGGVGEQLLDQTALADPSLPEDGHQPARSRYGLVERRADLRQGRLAADQRGLG
jgi:hypothetical protein